jgi:amidase
MGELWQLSATEAVDKLRGAELSPLEMVEAAAARITAVEPHINALPIRFFDEARAQAKAFRRQPADHPGWLAGLPIAIKDYNDVGGQLTTYGSLIFAEHRPSADDRTVATLRANGAIPLAKSNVPEFAGSHTFNPVWGITRNPWDLTRTAGGSSGGLRPRWRRTKSGSRMALASAARCAFRRAFAASLASGRAPASCHGATVCLLSTAFGWKVRWRVACLTSPSCWMPWWH